MRPALKQLGIWLLRKLYALCPWLDGPRVQRVEVAYEKAGVVVRGEPVPWNADAVLIDVEVWFPLRKYASKCDFYLDLPGEPPLTPVSPPPIDRDECARMHFRLPAQQRSVRVGLFWRSRLLGHITLAVLGREQFIENLKLESVCLFARLGDHNVPCQALVEGQCRSVTAAAVLQSPTSLLPILDLHPTLEVTLQRSRQTHFLPIHLTSGQLASAKTMVNLMLPPRLRFDGGASLHWTIAGRSVAHAELRTIGPQAFRDSLYAVESRYVYSEQDGTTGFSRYLFLQDTVSRLGPCFLIASREAGLAALHSFQVRVQYKDGETLPAYVEQEVLVTDGPSPFIPLTTTPEEFQKMSCFDLFNHGDHMAQLSLCTRDVATFTSEGGFLAPEDYPWTPIAEEELADHLRKLMEVPQSSDTGS